jgi:hypothetical protein
MVEVANLRPFLTRCRSHSAGIPDARTAYARQADEDWRSFLTHRAREMRGDARLVILTMARDDSGDFGYRQLIEAMYASLLDLVDQGLVLTEEMHRMAIPTFGRTRAEFEVAVRARWPLCRPLN